MGTLDKSMEQAQRTARKPAAVNWAIAVSAILGLLNFATVFLGLSMWSHAHDIVGALSPEVNPFAEEAKPLVQVIKMTALSFIPLGIIFGCLNFALCFLKPKPWVYVAHTVNLVLGIVGIILAPVCIAVLIQWNKDDVKAYFENA